jgi:hypothetical protein
MSWNVRMIRSLNELKALIDAAKKDGWLSVECYIPPNLQLPTEDLARERGYKPIFIFGQIVDCYIMTRCCILW